jgi:hypothetical protein
MSEKDVFGAQKRKIADFIKGDEEANSLHR